MPTKSKLLIPLKEALDSAFPEASSVEKRTIILDENQADMIEEIAKINLDSKIHIFYEFSNDSEILGYGIVDTHLLRTKSETVLYLLDNNGNIINSEILAFFEPDEYMQPAKWLNLYDNKNIGDELRIGKKIPNITGATITAHEFSRNTRKVLAIYKVAISNNN
ncbi:MAG: FMN-binding protein [Thermodesulfobacteriota bacterium]